MSDTEGAAFSSKDMGHSRATPLAVAAPRPSTTRPRDNRARPRRGPGRHDRASALAQTAAAPTAALSSIATATVIRSRSRSSRQTPTYNPAAGNRFVFNFDAGDGTARTEDVAVSLADRAVAGAHFGFVAKVPVEALYDATLSPLTFTLTNDCDFDFAGLIAQDSEPVIHWRDDRREDATGVLSMRAFNSLTINKLLPSTTHIESFNSRAETDEACNGHFSYTETVNLHTYNAL